MPYHTLIIFKEKKWINNICINSWIINIGESVPVHVMITAKPNKMLSQLVLNEQMIHSLFHVINIITAILFDTNIFQEWMHNPPPHIWFHNAFLHSQHGWKIIVVMKSLINNLVAEAYIWGGRWIFWIIWSKPGFQAVLGVLKTFKMKWKSFWKIISKDWILKQSGLFWKK